MLFTDLVPVLQPSSGVELILKDSIRGYLICPVFALQCFWESSPARRAPTLYLALDPTPNVFHVTVFGFVMSPTQ